MNEPFLSIVIPVYNAEPYLPICLDSLLSAEIPDLELILIDDGSTDGSLALCCRYSDRYAQIRVYHQDNAGPSKARNFGLENSHGQYISFFDADDVIDTAALQKTVEQLRHTDIELMASDFSRIARNGCVLDRIRQIGDSAEPICDSSYLIHFLSDGERVWNVWRYFFRRSFLLANEIRFLEGYDCAEDMEFMVRVLSCVKRPAFFHNPYYSYCVHYGDTLTQRYTVKRIQDLASMLTISAEHLEGRKDSVSTLLRDKLVKEFLLNLSLLSEVPPSECRAALSAYSVASPLLRSASDPKLKAVSLTVRTIGLRASSILLLQLKKIKRRYRRRVVKAYEKNVS